MEMLEKYESIVEKIETEKQEEMFYSVSKDMFIHFCENHPDLAKKYIDKLDGMRYRQFVTQEEAVKIVTSMHPAAKWGHDKLLEYLEELELDEQENCIFNYCALWVAISANYSDHAVSIAHAIGIKNPSDVPDETMIPIMYDLAIDKLKDKDNLYNVRDYYKL